MNMLKQTGAVVAFALVPLGAVSQMAALEGGGEDSLKNTTLNTVHITDKGGGSRVLRLNRRELSLYRDPLRKWGDQARNYRIEYNNFYPLDLHVDLLRAGMFASKVDGVFGAAIVKIRMNYTADFGVGVNGGVLREGKGILLGPSLSIHFDDFLSFQVNAGMNLKTDTAFFGGNFVFTPGNVGDVFKIGFSLGALYDGKDIKAQTGLVFPIGGTPNEKYWPKLEQKTKALQEKILAEPQKTPKVKNHTKANMKSRQAMEYTSAVRQRRK